MSAETDDALPEIKPALTNEQLIEQLQSRNLQVPNKTKAIEFLQKVNYYRLSAYFLTLYKEKDVFKDDATFDHIVKLYEFDAKLRNLLMEHLERIEVAFRTHISYLIGHKYGPLGYKNAENFINEEAHAKFMKKLQDSINESKGELFVRHHYQYYKGNFPIWVAMEILSFGPLSKLYANMHDEDKETIASPIYGVPSEYVESWLRTLSNIRNVCAHYARLYNKMIAFRPKISKRDSRIIRNERVFAAILVMGKLTTDKDERNNFVTRLDALISEYTDVIEMDLIGFPNKWDVILRKA